jgi:rubrerythrin
MHITNSLITFSKEAQTLENVKELETLTDRELTRAIRDAIVAEEGAINQYETVVDSTTNEAAKEILQSIADEERVHVGELQKLLNTLLPDEEKKLEEGAKEVEGDTTDTEEVEIEVEDEEDEEDTED